MVVISLCWCAAQQQGSTSNRKKSHSIYYNFSVEGNEFTSGFQNPQEVTKKLEKANNTRKTLIYVYRCLNVKPIVIKVVQNGATWHTFNQSHSKKISYFYIPHFEPIF